MTPLRFPNSHATILSVQWTCKYFKLKSCLCSGRANISSYNMQIFQATILSLLRAGKYFKVQFCLCMGVQIFQATILSVQCACKGFKQCTILSVQMLQIAQCTTEVCASSHFGHNDILRLRKRRKTMTYDALCT